MDTSYWNTLKGKLPEWNNGEEPISRKEQRKSSSCEKQTPSQIHSPAHPMKLRSGIRKQHKASPRLSQSRQIAGQQRLTDFCRAMSDEASSEISSVDSSSPQAEVHNKSNTDSSNDLEDSLVDGIPELMGEIYKDIHVASMPGLNAVVRRLTATQVLEPKPKGSTHWIRSSMWLDLAARNQVIGMSRKTSIPIASSFTKTFLGYALIWHTVPHHEISANFLAAVEQVQTVPVDQYHRAMGIVFFEERRCRRYGEFVTHLGWMMLSILAHSAAFRSLARLLEDDPWNELCKSIAENVNSLEVFAKVRNLDWKSALMSREEYDSVIAWNLGEAIPHLRSLDSLHAYVVPDGRKMLERPGYEGRRHIDIQSNLYLSRAFAGVPQPFTWPSSLRYPSDPTLVRHSKERCHLCNLRSCKCSPSDSSNVANPLVELRRHHAKGVIVRALQKVHAGAIIAEYTGLITPYMTSNPEYSDGTYGYILQPPGCTEPLAMISSKVYGNWTRYMSHSCNEHAVFRNMLIGGRYRAMLEAVRDIEVFEEITVNYGPSYFSSGDRLLKECLCGESCCKYRAKDW